MDKNASKEGSTLNIDKEFFEKFEGISDLFDTAQNMNTNDGPMEFEDKSFLACCAITKMLSYASWKIHDMTAHIIDLRSTIGRLNRELAEAKDLNAGYVPGRND